MNIRWKFHYMVVGYVLFVKGLVRLVVKAHTIAWLRPRQAFVARWSSSS